MTFAKLRSLSLQSVRRAPRTFALSVFGIAVGVASLSFFLALAAGVERRVIGRVFPKGRLLVVPARSSLDAGPLGGLGGLLGGPAPLSDETVAALRALPEVEAVHPRMKIAFPARGWGGESILGRAIYTELIIDGVDGGAVAGDIGPISFADHWVGPALGGAPPVLTAGAPGAMCTEDKNCTEPAFCAWDINRCQLPVPVVISPLLLELYNGSIAKSHNLPRIGDFLMSRFRGFRFTAELGRSFVSQRAHGTPRQRRFMLVGVSDRAIPLGLSVPLPYVQRWNAEYAGERAAREYSGLSVEVRAGRSVTRVVEAVRRLGYAIEDNGAEQAGLAVTLLSGVFLLISLGIVLVAVVNIAHTFFRSVSERRREFGVLRALGARARDVQLLVLCEAAMVGLCGGVAGLLTAFGVSLGVDFLSRRYLPDFPFKPDSYFAFSPWLCLGVLAFALLACWLGALWPARATAKMAPWEALSG